MNRLIFIILFNVSLFSSCTYIYNYIGRTKSFYFEHKNELKKLAVDLSDIDSSCVFEIKDFNKQEFELYLYNNREILIKIEELKKYNSNSDLEFYISSYNFDRENLILIFDQMKILEIRYIKFINKDHIQFELFPNIGLLYRNNGPMTDTYLEPNWYYYNYR